MDGSGFLLTIPAYRESGRLPDFLEALATMLEAHFPEGRIVVCDDGSGPEEQQELRERIAPILARHPSILPTLFLPENRGKGGAILAGWDAHPGYRVYGFIDADGAVSPGECRRVLEQLMADPAGTAYFASRSQMLGRKVERKFSRHVSGRIFAFVVARCIEADTHDSQCGLKLIPAAALARIRPWLKGRRFAFDVELLAALKCIGHPMIEVPIDWRDVPGNQLRFIRDSLRMTRAVLEIRREMKERMGQSL